MTEDIHRPDDAMDDGDRPQRARSAQRPDANAAFEATVQAFAAVHRDAPTLLGALAHELRNPLAPLSSSIALLRRTDLPAPARDRAIDVMDRQLAQLKHVVDALARHAQAKLPANSVAGAGGSPAPVERAERAEQSMPATAQSEFRSDDDAQRRAERAGQSMPVTAQSESRSDDDAQRASRRVLIADDNELVQQSMAQLLTSEGFEVRTASDGVEAIDVVAQWSPRFVILDAYMPRLSGIETARRLRALHPPARLTLLLMSGVALTPAWIEHAREVGFDDCLDKGASPAQWVARLRLGEPAPG